MAHGGVWADIELWKMEGRVLDLFCCQLEEGRLSACALLGVGVHVCILCMYLCVCTDTGVCGR